MVIQQTLDIWVGHEVKEPSEQGVGCGVRPGKVEIQNKHGEPIFTKRRATIATLVREGRPFDSGLRLSLSLIQIHFI